MSIELNKEEKKMIDDGNRKVVKNEIIFGRY